VGSARSHLSLAEPRRPSWPTFALAVATLLHVACTCGPEVPGTATDSETTTDTGSPTSDATETSPSARCGDGIPVAGEYCFGRVDLDVPAEHLAVGDFDGDGVPDIATNHFEEGVGTVQLIMWRPGANPVVQDPVESRSRSELSLLVDDFDGDDDVDLLVAVPGELRLHRNDGTGQLSPEQLDDSSIFWPSAAIDLDANGRSEIVAGTGSGPQILAYGLVGEEWIALGEPYDMSACVAYSLLATDLDADGNDDVVVVGWPGECPAFPDYEADLIPVAVFRGQGDGSLAFAGELETGVQPIEAAAGDLSGDGIPDLVVLNQGSLDLSVLTGTGSLGFAPQRRLAFDDLGTPLRNATIADVDGDGTRELLVTVDRRLYAVADPLGASTATELAETTYPVEVADVNADGVLDIVLLRPGSPLQVSVLVSEP
jgi:hypothetical protein